MVTPVGAITNFQRIHFRDKIFGLSVACPFDQDNPCDCPLYEVRKKSMEERYAWVRELSDVRILSILTYHQKCLDEREDLKDKGELRA